MAAMVRLVDEEKTLSAIKEVKDLVETSIGPYGRLKVLQTKAGGYAMMTTTSSKMLDFFVSTNTIAQILLSSLKSHLRIYKNGGLFLASLASNLFLAHSQSGMTRNECVMVNGYVQEQICQIMEKGNLAQRLDIGKLREMKILVESILTSKPVCQLSAQDIAHLSVSILKAFFKGIVATSGYLKEDGITIMLNEGPPIIESHVVSGCLLKLPTLDVISEKLLSLIKGPVKIIVFAASLAGDQTVIDDSFEMAKDDSFIIDDVTYDQLLRLADSVAMSGVQILCCQKVVHPTLRIYLEKKGVLVIERLGYQLVKKLCSVAQLQPVESHLCSIADANIGNLEKVKVYNFSGKRYLVFQPPLANEIDTLMLCANDENTLEELKCTIQSIEKTLFHVVEDSRVLCGGGCFEAQISSFVRGLVERQLTEEERENYEGLENFGEASWGSALENIASSFSSVARSLYKDSGECYVDTTFNHLWCFPINVEPDLVTDTQYTCCCGSIDFCPHLSFESLHFERTSSVSTTSGTVKEQPLPRLPEVMDSMFLRRECIATAFELCNVMLRVGITLEQRN